MIKRRLGSALRARSYWSQSREIILRVVTHNVMIVIRIRVFYRAGSTSHFDSIRSLKFYLYLDDVTVDNGAFEYAPGTSAANYADAKRFWRWGGRVRDIP